MNDGVKFFDNKGKKIILSSGKEIDMDMIILLIGVKLEIVIVKDVNIKINEKGVIVVDKNMKIFDFNIYVLGDVVEIMDFVNKKFIMILLVWFVNC